MAPRLINMSKEHAALRGRLPRGTTDILAGGCSNSYSLECRGTGRQCILQGREAALHRGVIQTDPQPAWKHREVPTEHCLLVQRASMDRWTAPGTHCSPQQEEGDAVALPQAQGWHS